MVAMFVAGAVAGSVWSTSQTQTQETKSPCYRELSSNLTERLRAELALTDDQLKKISPEICRACSELTNIHHQTVMAGWAALSNCYQNIEGILTEPQKAKLNNCETKHQHQLLLHQEMIRNRDNH